MVVLFLKKGPQTSWLSGRKKNRDWLKTLGHTGFLNQPPLVYNTVVKIFIQNHHREKTWEISLQNSQFHHRQVLVVQARAVQLWHEITGSTRTWWFVDTWTREFSWCPIGLTAATTWGIISISHTSTCMYEHGRFPLRTLRWQALLFLSRDVWFVS